MVEPIGAQSTSKPSAPKFSIQFPNNTTIQLVIENQPFTSSSSVNSIIYYYRVKDHYSERCSIDKNYHVQSNSETTTITIPSVPGPLFPPIVYSTLLNNSTLIDFQVQAQTGYYAITNKSGPPALISPAPQQWHIEITFNESETSDWSSLITVDLSKMAVVTADPTQSVPEFPLTILLVAVLIVVGLLMVISERRLAGNESLRTILRV